MVFSLATIILFIAFAYCTSNKIESAVNKLFFVLLRLFELPFYFIAYSAIPASLMIGIIYFGYNFNGLNVLFAFVIIGALLLTANKYIELNKKRNGKWFKGA